MLARTGGTLLALVRIGKVMLAVEMIGTAANLMWGMGTGKSKA